MDWTGITFDNRSRCRAGLCGIEFFPFIWFPGFSSKQQSRNVTELEMQSLQPNPNVIVKGKMQIPDSEQLVHKIVINISH